MRFYKLRVTPNAAGIASTFNAQFKPEIIPENTDPFRVDWIFGPSDDVLVGEKATFLLFVTESQLKSKSLRPFGWRILRVRDIRYSGPSMERSSMREITPHYK
jgi:hypothetical protein